MPITSNDINDASIVHIPELLEPTDPHMVLRGAHMELLALLQSGDIDYTIDYKSMVIKDGLRYLELPPEINLSDKSMAAEYQKVVIKMDYRRFKTIDPVFQGLPIIYGMTIANNSTHQAAAEKLVQFVLSADSQRIFQSSNQPELIPPQCDNISALPDSLKPSFR